MSHKLTAPPKGELTDLYKREGTTISSLSKHYGTSNATVRKWLVQYDIPRKSHLQASKEANNRQKGSNKPTKKELFDLYQENTIDSLELYFSVGQQTIYQWLEEYKIPIRSLSESCEIGKKKQFSNIQFSKEFLEKEYDRTKPVTDLADKLEVSRSHILKLFKQYDIEIEKFEPTWRSKSEIELANFLSETFPEDEWIFNDKSIINPYELDIVNETKKIAIEYCGLYWHSEGSGGKKSGYHKEKYLRCKEKGYTLFTIFESDDIEKVNCLLLKVLGKTSRVGARKTVCRKLTSKQAMNFHNEHHLHSGVGAAHHYGLFHDEDLLMVASFGKNRFGKKYQYECTRITSHSAITVIGGVSKLIKTFIRETDPESIITFSDLRFGEGKVYLNCGFTAEELSGPNYWYFKGNTNKLFSRVKFQKHKLPSLLESFDSNKTEYENMLDNGWDRIWDCGNAKYVWEKEKGRTE